jgi:predicted nucleic acid-binding protein
MRVALDTNILAYAEGINAAGKRDAALELIQQLSERIVLPVQALDELFYVLVRKAGRAPQEARGAILNWQDAFPVAETSTPVMLAGMDLAVQHQLSIWDAVIVSAAAHAGCRLVLSEDLQDGFTWHGVTVANPFCVPRHALLSSLLEGGTASMPSRSG